MIYVNHKAVDLSACHDYKGDDSLKQEISKNLKVLDSYPEDVTLKLKKGLVVVNKKNKRPEHKKILVPFTTGVKSSRGSEIWIYADSRKKDRDGNWTYDPLGFWFNKPRKTFLKSENYDMLYFFFFCSSLIGPSSGNTDIVIEDREKESREKFYEGMPEAKLRYFIGEMPEEKLRKVCAANGLLSDNKGEFELRNELVVFVIKRVKTKQLSGVDDWIESMKIDKAIEISANARKAMNDGIVVFNPGTSAYHWTDSSNIPVDQIIGIAHSEIDQREDILIDYFENNPTAYERLKNSLGFGDRAKKGEKEIMPRRIDDEESKAVEYGSKPEPPLAQKFNLEGPDDLENLEFGTLKTVAKEAGIKSFGMKKPEIIEELNKKLFE